MRRNKMVIDQTATAWSNRKNQSTYWIFVQRPFFLFTTNPSTKNMYSHALREILTKFSWKIISTKPLTNSQSTLIR